MIIHTQSAQQMTDGGCSELLCHAAHLGVGEVIHHTTRGAHNDMRTFAQCNCLQSIAAALISLGFSENVTFVLRMRAPCAHVKTSAPNGDVSFHGY